MRVPLFLVGLLAATVSAATIASAATITVDGPAPIFTGPLIIEDFSGHSVCGQSGTVSTSAGSFRNTGASGHGNSVCNDTNSPQVRTGRNWGRTAAGFGTNFLDSNDVSQITWTLPDGARGASFWLTDVGDIKNTTDFTLRSGTDVASILPAPNGSIHFVSILFDQFDLREIVMTMNRTRPGYDGWGVSGITVAAVPLPAAGLLLLGGLGLLGWRARRATPAAA